MPTHPSCRVDSIARHTDSCIDFLLVPCIGGVGDDAADVGGVVLRHPNVSRPDDFIIAVVGSYQGVALLTGTHVDLVIQPIISRSRAAVYPDQVPLAVVAYGILGLPDDPHVLGHVIQIIVDLCVFISIRGEVVGELISAVLLRPVVRQEREELPRLHHEIVRRRNARRDRRRCPARHGRCGCAMLWSLQLSAPG